jgi:hypothetical protein
MRIIRIGSLAAALALGLAACGGGGGTMPSSPSVPQSPAPANPSGPQAHAVKAQVVLHIPAKTNTASQTRQPAFVSPSTSSVSIAVNGGAAQSVSLTPGSPNCTGTPLTCTVPISGGVIGSNTFVFKTFDNASPTPHVLSTNTVMQTLTANTTNNINATLNGIPASYSTSLVNPTGIFDAVLTGGGSQLVFAQSTVSGAENAQILVTPLDADGNTIIGAGTPTVGATGSSPTLAVNPVSATPNEFLITDEVSEQAAITYSAPGLNGTSVPGTVTVFANAARPPFMLTDNEANIGNGSAVTLSVSGYFGPITISPISGSAVPFSISDCTSGNETLLSNPTLTIGTTPAVFEIGNTLPSDNCIITFTDAFGDSFETFANPD